MSPLILLYNFHPSLGGSSNVAKNKLGENNSSIQKVGGENKIVQILTSDPLL